jgi:hypothetical protein
LDHILILTVIPASDHCGGRLVSELGVFQLRCERELTERLASISQRLRDRRIGSLGSSDEPVICARAGTLEVRIFVDGVSITDPEQGERRFEEQGFKSPNELIRAVGDYLVARLTRARDM